MRDLPIAAVASNAPASARSSGPRMRRSRRPRFRLEDFADREARDAAMADWLEALGVRLVVCAGYMHLLRPSFLARFPGRVVNVHPALLPAFPGAHAVEEALAAGVTETGCDGPPRRRRHRHRRRAAPGGVPVLPDDTPDTLHARIRVSSTGCCPRSCGS